MLTPRLGVGGQVSLGILPSFLLICVGGNDPLCPFRVVADDEA